ncbi:MAG: hypothetical protein IJW15_00010 [Clostridia bacterium]|nr:hypothetical protein [Clostridia bacterium]
MKKSLYKWQLAGFIFTSIAGVLLHFLFDWTSGSVLVALFSAVNESIWEHMKLMFFPMFFYALVESRYIGKEYKNFWCVKLMGIVLGVVLIPVVYYTINGIFGMTPDWMNITIFFVVAATSYFVETQLFKKGGESCKSSRIVLVTLWLVALIFVVFTFAPPQIPLFRAPVTGTYGF